MNTSATDLHGRTLGLLGLGKIGTRTRRVSLRRHAGGQVDLPLVSVASAVGGALRESSCPGPAGLA
ncbi:hypothetical protein [Streptomyces sp. NPDC002671]